MIARSAAEIRMENDLLHEISQNELEHMSGGVKAL
jgi:hypothetical protein